MTPTESHVLAAIDASEYSAAVCDMAALAARRLNCGVEVLHIVQRPDSVARRRDLSGAVGLGAKSGLMAELAEIDAAEAKLARQRGDLILSGAEERLRSAGIDDVTVTHRHGDIVETIVERERQATLVVLGQRGASAGFAPGHLGSKVERVVRASDRPVLVAARDYREVRRIVIAYDGGATSDKAAALAATNPLAAGCAILMVMAGREDDGTRRAKLEDAAARFTDHDVDIRLTDGPAEEVIADAARDFGADLLLMGAYGHSPLRRLIVGSTTTTMLQTLDIPVLLFR
ncbi:MAG: universal stress protein [Pseudomonadota bacterium]